MFGAANYYYTHDARREMKPPTVLVVNSKDSLKYLAKPTEAKYVYLKIVSLSSSLNS